MSSCPVLTRVRAFLGKCRGMEKGVLVGVSGGADSICLSHALWVLGNQGLFPRMILAHVNHGLRGDESDADEVFVREFFQSLKGSGKVQLSMLFDKPGMDPGAGRNLEGNARDQRYRFFSQMAQSENVSWVLTGHNRDDQIETVWMKLLRGASLRGLAGIPARRTLNGETSLGRPILKISRKRILQYLKNHELSWREDSSNVQTRFLRNRLRQQVLPELRRQFQERVDLGILRLADSARRAAGLEESLVLQVLPKVEKPRVESQVVLSLEAMRKTPMVLRSALLLHLWRREGWSMDPINSFRWREIAKNMVNTGWRANLPGGIILESTSFTIVIGPGANH